MAKSVKRISETKSQLVKEHKRLVKVLKSGDRRALMREERKQARELREYIKSKMGRNC